MVLMIHKKELFHFVVELVCMHLNQKCNAFQFYHKFFLKNQITMIYLWFL